MSSSLNKDLDRINNIIHHKNSDLKAAVFDLQQLLKNAELGIIIVDEDMNIRRCNDRGDDSFMVDQSSGKLTLSYNVYTEELISELRSSFDEFKASKKIISSPRERWYLVRINPYKRDNGILKNAIVTFEDITECKNTQQELVAQANNGESIAKLGTYILESRDSRQVMNRAVELVSEKLVADVTGLLTLKENGSELQLQSEVGWTEFIHSQKLRINRKRAVEFEHILNKEEPVVVQDFQNDDRFNKSKLLSESTLSSGILVSIKSAKNLFGLFGVFFRNLREFKKYEIELVHHTANLVGEAIERLKTENELQKAYDELEHRAELQNKLEHEILEIEKKERWRIGQYLHDETAQKLLYIKMMIDSTFPEINLTGKKIENKLNEIEKTIKESLEDIRELSHFILPIEIGKKDTSSSFRKLAKQTQSLYCIDCRFTSDGSLNKIEDASVTSYLYYIAQEGIRNAINHGEATSIIIDIYEDPSDDYLHLIVKDNGKGLKEGESDQGMGINIMNYRAELLGGSLKIKSGDAGTVLKCTVPWKNIINKN